MKYIIFICLLYFGLGLPMRGFAQPKCYILSYDIFPDRAGKVVAFKVSYENVPDTVYFIDVASGDITDRVAEGTFGLEFKMMKAKVLNREALKDLKVRPFISAWGRGKLEKFYRYDILMKNNSSMEDSTLASAWLPYTFSQHPNDMICVVKLNPKTVLLYGRLDGKKAMYNMLDTSDKGIARLLYLDKENKFSSSFRWQAHVSPDGHYVLAATEGAMIDLAKGKVIWEYPSEDVKGWFYATFSEDGKQVAIERGNYTVAVWDIQRGKELYRISVPPDHLANLAGLDCIIPLPDMQHALVYDHNPNTGRVKVLLVKADGSYKELRF